MSTPRLVNKFLLLLTFVFILKFTSAQGIENIRGKVSDFTGKPVSGATVILSDDNKKIIAFGSSDSNGTYAIPLKEKGEFSLAVRSIGYISQEYVFSRLEERVIVKDFTLETDVKVMEEVIVQRSDVEPDSVAIEIENLGLHENSTLQEILSKHPAFSVGEDGAILYKGKNIDKININNTPAFINQNKIAIESLEKRMIEDVSVRNNFQDQFTISFQDRRETLLNINTKENMKNIALGEGEGAYGLSDKYEARGRLLYFSRPVNTFFTHNTNNFGSQNLELNEINQMFNSSGSFSAVERNLVSSLFDGNIARFTDFRSTSTATIRHQKENYRVHSVTYYLSNNRGATQNVNNITPDGNLLLSQENRNRENFNAILNKSAIDWRVNQNLIFGYNIKVNAIWNRDTRNSLTNLYDNGAVISNPLNSIGSTDNVRIFQEIYHTQRYGKSLLQENKVGFEYVRTSDDREVLQADEPLLRRQPKFAMSDFTVSSKLQYKRRIIMMPWVDYNLKISDQNATQRRDDFIYQRDLITQQFNVGISGQELYKYVKYEASFGMNIYSINNESQLVVPYNVNISYDKRLDRWYTSVKRQYQVNDIAFAVDRIENYMDVTLGNSVLMNGVNIQDNYRLGYSSNNLFAGRSWGFVMSYDNFQNNVGQNFLEVDNAGIRYFETRIIPRVQSATASLNMGRRVLSSSYPMTLSGDLGYQHVRNTAFNGEQQFTMTQRGPKLGVKLESLSPSWFNFALRSNGNLFSVSSLDQVFDAQSVKSSLELIARKGNFEGRIDFLYWIDNLYGNRFDRKNVGVYLEYRKQKYSFGIRGRNIDDFLPVFNNAAFNNYITINQGINTVVTNNQAIRYMLLFLKYRIN